MAAKKQPQPTVKLYKVRLGQDHFELLEFDAVPMNGGRYRCTEPGYSRSHTYLVDGYAADLTPEAAIARWQEYWQRSFEESAKRWKRTKQVKRNANKFLAEQGKPNAF